MLGFGSGEAEQCALVGPSERQVDVLQSPSGQRRRLTPFDDQGRDTLVEHIQRTGCTIAGTPVWTAGELEALRLLYPDKQALTAALPRRTEGAIAHKARNCGLVPPLRIWTNGDAAQLRRPYVAGVPVTKLTEMFPGKSKRQITWRGALAMIPISLIRPATA